MDKITQIAKHHSEEILQEFKKNQYQTKFYFDFIVIDYFLYNEVYIEAYKKAMESFLFDFDLTFQKLNNENSKITVIGKRKNVPHLISSEIIDNMRITEMEYFKNQILGSFGVPDNLTLKNGSTIKLTDKQNHHSTAKGKSLNMLEWYE